jgi:hypothetical protein
MNDRALLRRNHLCTVKKIYPTAICLKDYVESITTIDRSLILNYDDSLQYQNFVEFTFVVPEVKNGSESTSLCIKDQQFSSTYRDFLNRFVAQLVKSNLPYREQNCLSYGYRAKKINTDCGIRSQTGLECYFVNTLHNLVTSKVWHQFALRVGEQVMKNVLMRPVFMQCVSTLGCFIQVRCKLIASNDLYFSVTFNP